VLQGIPAHVDSLTQLTPIQTLIGVSEVSGHSKQELEDQLPESTSDVFWVSCCKPKNGWFHLPFFSDEIFGATSLTSGFFRLHPRYERLDLECNGKLNAADLQHALP